MVCRARERMHAVIPEPQVVIRGRERSERSTPARTKISLISCGSFSVTAKGWKEASRDGIADRNSTVPPSSGVSLSTSVKGTLKLPGICPLRRPARAAKA